MLNKQEYPGKEKYFDKYDYQEKARKLLNSNNQIDFSNEEKESMLHDMVKYIEEKNFDMYHKFMNDVVENEKWFNFWCFDIRVQQYLKTYIKARVQKLRTNHTGWKEIDLTINSSCYKEGVLMPKCCYSCVFDFGTVCAGGAKRTDNGESTYGMPMEEAEAMFPNGCEDYEIALWAYEELLEKYMEE